MVVAHSFSRDEEADRSETVRHDDDKQRQLLSTGAAAAAAVTQGRREAGCGMEVVVFVASAIGEQTRLGVLVDEAATTFIHSIITLKRYIRLAQ